MTNQQNKTDYAAVLIHGRQFLDNSDSEACLNFLIPILKEQEALDGFASASSNGLLLETIQLAGEAFLEQGNTPEAYPLLQAAANADPSGELGGIEKFLWLGQILGSKDGIKSYEQGIEGLKREISQSVSSSTDNSELLFKKKKLCDAYCGIIEIWMTDLCMEPEAEANCDNLITQAMFVDSENSENWNVMGSIRISQQRNEDAKNALSKSWDLYHQQFSNTPFAQRIQEQQQQLIPSLIRLAQNSMEVALFRNVVEVTAEIQRLDDQVAESYYLHGLARAELYKKLLEEAKAASSPEEQNKFIREANKNAVRARDAWETLLKLVAEEPDLVDPELAPTVAENLKALPDSISSDDYDSSDDEDENEDIDINDLE